jgi:hypothetical protein
MLTYADYCCLPQPAQLGLLARHGRLLATRREGGIGQRLYDVRGFYVETWHWHADPDEVSLLFSYADVNRLDAWLAEL